MELEVRIERGHQRTSAHNQLGGIRVSTGVGGTHPSARGGPARFAGTEARSTRPTIGASLYSVRRAFSIVDSNCSLSAVKRSVSARNLSSCRLSTGLWSAERMERSDRLFRRKL